jgi:type II secretory pathway pseudopilin PulG
MLNNNKRGFTLIEILFMLGFMALAGLFIVGAASKILGANSELEHKRSNENLNSGSQSINHSQQVCGINDVLKEGCEGKVVIQNGSR